MNRVNVRCWEMHAGKDKVVISYPEKNYGYDLGICRNCGHIYAVEVAKLVYAGPPLAERLEGLSCERCSMKLALTWASYPETYLTAAGAIAAFLRPTRIPDDALSEIRSFPSIY